MALAVGVVTVLALGTVQAVGMFTPAYDIPISGSPDCGTGRQVVLIAQAVPSATQVPCLAALPAGWALGEVDIERYEASFSLDSDQAGDRAVEATLQPATAASSTGPCPRPATRWAPSAWSGPTSWRPACGRRASTCSPAAASPTGSTSPTTPAPGLIFDVEQALGFVPRGVLADHVRDQTGLTLCGAGTECTGG